MAETYYTYTILFDAVAPDGVSHPCHVTIKDATRDMFLLKTKHPLLVGAGEMIETIRNDIEAGVGLEAGK